MAKFATLTAAILVVLAFTTDARSVASSKKDLKIEPIGGFLLYRVKDNRIEYLLLKKAKEDDWSPPKGNLEEPESVFDTAIRETREETSYQVCTDYDVHIQYKVYFEYETKDDELKQVHLWPAELSDFEKPIQLSPENSEYAWLEYDQALATIKRQYRVGLTQGDTIIRAHESLPTGQNN